MDPDLAQQQLNLARAQDIRKQEELQAQDRARQAAGGQKTGAEKVPLPWLMLCVAAIFDLVGMIPIVSIFSEIIAGIILWFWQKTYVPKLNPLVSIVVTKIIDFIFGLGLVSWLPSNLSTVIIAYIKKKAEAKAKTKIGGKIIAKLAA